MKQNILNVPETYEMRAFEKKGIYIMEDKLLEVNSPIFQRMFCFLKTHENSGMW